MEYSRLLPRLTLLPTFPEQVDKGVVPLAGTNGETTTQGENCSAPRAPDQPIPGRYPSGCQLPPPLPCSDSSVPPQGWMGCLSAAPSTRRTELTSPSGAVC